MRFPKEVYGQNHVWISDKLLQSRKGTNDMCERHEQVLSVFTRRIVRAKPDDPEGFQARICASNLKLLILGHWGVGQKWEPNQADRLALDRLKEIMDLTGGLVQFLLLLADEHGRLNGLPENSVRHYLERIGELARERGITADWLSLLWPQWGVREPFREIPDEAWEANPLAEILEKRAVRYHRGDRSPREDAKRYYVMTQVEGRAIAQAFPGVIWFTYGDPHLRDLYPPMPTIYIWPYKKGRSHAPWFS